MLFRHFRADKGTGAEMSPAIVSGIVTGDAPVSCWPIFFPVLSNRPRSLKIPQRQRPRKGRLKSELALFQFLFGLFQLAYSVKRKRTLLKPHS